jgi:hypothetical protein
MKLLFKTYFSHTTIPLLWFFFFILALLNVSFEAYQSFWFFYILPWFLGPFVEWILHKFVLHTMVPKDHPKFDFHYKLHYAHHKNPHDLYYVFAPLNCVVLLFVILFFAFSLLGWSFLGGLAGLTSSTLYFLFYEWVHLGQHIPNYVPFTAIGKYMKKTHLWHHFKNEDQWWGITSPIADWLMKTSPHHREVNQHLPLQNLVK